jgi:Domain of unknown function (DUF4905)
MWNYTSVLPIWKILPDTENNLLVLEKRDPEKQQVYFDILDIQNREIIVENLILWENWWVSVVAASHQKIVFALYEQENSVANKGFIVYGIAEKQILWQSTQLHFDYLDALNECIWIRENLESTILKPYHLQTGYLIKENLIINDKKIDCYFPLVYTHENPYFKDLEHFILLKSSQTASNFVTYLEYKAYICMVYDTEIEEKFAYFLLITDIAGNVKICQQVSDVKNIYQPYFVFNNFLILNPNPNELNIYSLA